MNPCFDYANYGSQTALYDSSSDKTISYKELSQNSERCNGQFPDRALILLFLHPQLDFVLAYLGLINTDCAIALLDGNLDLSLKQALIQNYQPHYVIDTIEHAGYHKIKSLFSSLTVSKIADREKAPDLHPELKLLLSTSGTTGSPKLVRLSAYNFLTNAASIATYLSIDEKERPIASLPFHYSYGLSVLHSHLLMGASVVITPYSIVQKEFWDSVNKYRCTSFSGVPYMYQMLDQLRFDMEAYPSIQTLTQAGGRLKPELTVKFFRQMRAKNGRYYTMYGQTEATARIAYLPYGYLPEKAGSIGIAIPGGDLKIADGELVYQGPNVMLGYAQKKENLALGDVLKGILFTGDLGFQDEDGIFAITGRLKRISKIYGQRINLDEIEAALSPLGRYAATSDDAKIYLFSEQGSNRKECIHLLHQKYHLDKSSFQFEEIGSFPLTSSGKIDYQKLKVGHETT